MFTGLGGVFGGVGNLGNFLEIQVNRTAAGTPGVLTIDDTAAPFTLGVYVTQTSGNLWVNTVHTNGSAALTTLAGSILDGRNGGLGDTTPRSERAGRLLPGAERCCELRRALRSRRQHRQSGVTKGCNNDDGIVPPSTVGIPRCLPQSDFKIDSSHLAPRASRWSPRTGSTSPRRTVR